MKLYFSTSILFAILISFVAVIDNMIERNTHLIGYCILWCFFIITCMVVNVAIGSIILIAALVTIKFVESIAVLIQYSIGNKGEIHE